MINNLFLATNGTIVVCYLAIAFLIFRGLIQGQQHLFNNPLVVATSAIFLSCALGHGAHILVMAVGEKDIDLPVMGIQVGLDLVTAIVAVTYLALRRHYSLLIDGPLLLAQTQNQLAQANEKLTKINAHLEFLVAERTKDLLKANQQLSSEINERKQAEAERECLLRQLENERSYLEAVLQQMPSGVAIAEVPSGKLLLHNEEALQLLRHPLLTSDDYHGYAQYGAFHANGQPYAPEEYPLAHAVISGEVLKQEEVIYRRGDGTWTVLSVNAAPLRAQDGRIVAAVSTFYDICAKKQAEEALQQTNSMLCAVIEGTTDAIFMKDLQGRYLMLNSATAKVVGKPVQEIIGKDDAAIFPRDLASLIINNDRIILASEVAESSEEIIPVMGELRTFFSVKTVCRNEQGKVIGLVGISRDITERKQAEQALRDALQKLSFHVQNTPLAVLEWDNNACLQRWSQQAEKIFGWKAEEVIGKSFTDWQFVFEEDLEQVQAKTAGLADGSQSSQVCCNRNYTKDGSVIDCEWYNSALLDEAGNLVSILCLVQDVSDRKRAEQQIRELNQDLERRVIERTTQLEAANQELEAFSYSVSHDLRAPLRSIDGFSLALLERYESQLDDKGKHYLERVRAASQRMGHLIDDLLQLSRVTRREMQQQTVDLSAMVAEIAAELEQIQPERSVELIIASGVLAEGDARLLRVVLENLLNNAWKFTSKKAHPQIKFGIIAEIPPIPFKLNQALPENYLRSSASICGLKSAQVYFIRDNGAGFDMAYADKLFGAFQRLHTTNEFPGTGIGLATVQRIIHRHGGRVWAEAAVEQGATFYFTLQHQ